MDDVGAGSTTRPVAASDIAAATERIAPHIRHTELFRSEPMSDRTGSTVLVKAEHAQHTGSFKLRGALNTVLSLDDASKAGGVITASSGNHGIAVATAANLAGVACTVYLPDGCSPAKVAAVGRLGATIVTVDSTDAYQAEAEARATADERGVIYVSPYNDRRVVAGQGTVGKEILDAIDLDAGPWPDAIVASVGGGGLISGVGTWVKANRPSIAIVGASPANDAAMVASIAAGRIVDIEAGETFSDGTAGSIEPDAVTFDLCRSVVDEWHTVTEPEIATAVRAMIDDHHQLVEGAAGVALAAAERWAAAHPGSTVVAISCGANIASTKLAALLG